MIHTPFGHDGDEWKPEVGIYALKDGGPVFIEEATEKGWFRVSYVQILPSGEVICGGGSFWWEPSRFQPITNPQQVLGCRIYHARKRQKELTEEAKRAEYYANANLAALKVLREFSQAKENEK